MSLDLDLHLVFLKSMTMKKVYMLKLLVKTILAFAFASLLLLQSVKAAGKTPTLGYAIIRMNNNAHPWMSAHPPPVNDHPTRGCNAENLCRHFTLSVENPSGTRVEAVATLELGAPINRSSVPGTEAIAAAIAAWSMNKTKTNGNAYGRLSVSMDVDAGSAQMLQQQAVSRGIARMGLDVQNRSISTEDAAHLPPADGDITIRVDDTSNLVELKFFTHVRSLGEADIIHILEYAKALLQAIQN